MEGRTKVLCVDFSQLQLLMARYHLCFHSCKEVLLSLGKAVICINKNKTIFCEQIYCDYRSCKLMFEYSLKCLGQHVLKCT